jgi:DNA-binding NarL/FixJ family response regulator
MSHHLDLIDQAGRLLPDPPDDPDTALARLTHREWEVLCLIVARRTDREIADRLFISYRTVTSHVTNILNKLGVSSRRDAAEVATRGLAA